MNKLKLLKMIDYTTLQIEPIPLSIITLQKTNTILKNENDVFKDIIKFVLIGGAIIIVYNIYKNIEENEQDIRR